MEDRSDVRIRSLGRKGKLLLRIIAITMGLALFLKISSIFYPSVFLSLTNSVLSFPGNATFLTAIAAAAICLVLVSGRKRLANCRLRRLFLPSRRISVLIPSVSSDGSVLLIDGKKKHVDSFAISMLKLLTVPSEGVRQRVRGAVARDEQEKGAAVSDEKQYQFSHLASLFQTEQRQGSAAYEIQFNNGLVSVEFTASAHHIAECKRRKEQIKASVQSKFPIQLVEVSKKPLENAVFMGLTSKDRQEAKPVGHLELTALDDRVALVETSSRKAYASVVALVGRPEMSAHEQRCQIDQLITGVNSALKYSYRSDEATHVYVSFTVPFARSKPPKYPSDASLREKLRDKPDVRLSLKRKRVEVEAMEIEYGHRTGWWKVSPYAIILGSDSTLVKEKTESVASVLRSVWSGSHFSPESVFLHSKELVKYFARILRRCLLPTRFTTEMSSIRLSSLIHIPEEPHPPLSRTVPPSFEVLDPETSLGSDANSGAVVLGDILSSVGDILYPLTLPIGVLGTHMSVFGESGRGKTCFVLSLLEGLLDGFRPDTTKRAYGERVPFLVLDQKGEYRCLVARPEYGVAYFLPCSRVAPLKINLFDPQGDDAESHAKRMFSIIREILFANRTELTPQMERVLYDVLRTSIGGDWFTFNDNLTEYLVAHGEELPQLGATIQGILNRVGEFTRAPLSDVFDCKESNVNFSYLVERSAVIDLSELRKLGTPEDVRLVANIIGKYVSVASLNRGADFSGELKHLFIIDDALDVVPEVLAKKTTADVGTIEYMAMLLRATGQGLVVVSQRPNIAENVIANSGIKIFFRTVVDSREVAAWANLSEDQAAYLKVLPKQEAIVIVPEYSAPLRIRIPDVSSFAGARVTDQQVIENNMINYPVMYEMQNVRESHKPEMNGEAENKETMTAERESTREGREGERKQKHEQRGQQEPILEDGSISKVVPNDGEALSKIQDYLKRGVGIDSDFVSKVVGVSQPAAHRKMLSLKSAGLIGVAKVPNYTYGEGYQYVYYSKNKTVYGGGVVGYVRERIYNDLMGREAVASLSPKDVPSADMIVQNGYPLIVHMTSSSGSEGTRLSALNERIRKVADEFNMMKGLHTGSWCGVETSRVIVVTLWKQAADELNNARREGRVKGCLCIIPFVKKWVDTLADYVLNHIPLQILLGEQQEGEQDENESKDRINIAEEAEKNEAEEKKRKQGKELAVSVEGAVSATVQEKVLSLVQELGGVEPRILAERLRVPLWKISRVARRLKDEGVIRVALNIPDLRSAKRANATLYLDGEKPTSLHDAVMNMVWERNIELGGRSRDFSFEYAGKTWYSDGLLENTGGRYILEVAVGDYEGRIIDQIQAYSTQIGHKGIRGVVVVMLNQVCLERTREEVKKRSVTDPESRLVVLTTLRSSDEKKQLGNLLFGGKPMAYHRNPTSS